VLKLEKYDKLKVACKSLLGQHAAVKNTLLFLRFCSVSIDFHFLKGFNVTILLNYTNSSVAFL